MHILEKHMVIVLAVSTTLVLFNIIAVTSGSADIYYSEVEHFLLNFSMGQH